MSKHIAVFETVHYVKLADLRLHPKNDEMRTISPSQWAALKESITKGFFEPIHVWAQDGTVLAGNHRVMVARELVKEGYAFQSPVGENCLPVVIHEVDAQRAQEILFQTNNQYAEWIDAGLKRELQRFAESGGNVKLLGFSAAHVDSLLGDAVRDAHQTMEKLKATLPKTEAERTVAPVHLDDVTARVARTEETLKNVALWLGEDYHAQLTTILVEVAKKLNPRWKEGDSFNEAVGAVVQLWRERDLLVEVEA